ncbi:hypothetical protein B0H12DRAFT_1074077 [Mycena haematopus]|nr:hypothetical protein B0H12DRAFT_1074077 [Mycena haematopus]
MLRTSSAAGSDRAVREVRQRTKAMEAREATKAREAREAMDPVGACATGDMKTTTAQTPNTICRGDGDDGNPHRHRHRQELRVRARPLVRGYSASSSDLVAVHTGVFVRIPTAKRRSDPEGSNSATCARSCGSTCARKVSTSVEHARHGSAGHAGSSLRGERRTPRSMSAGDGWPTHRRTTSAGPRSVGFRVTTAPQTRRVWDGELASSMRVKGTEVGSRLKAKCSGRSSKAKHGYEGRLRARSGDGRDSSRSGNRAIGRRASSTCRRAS